MDINAEFLNLYNQLDAALRYIVNGTSGVTYIQPYEKTLPFEKRRLLEEIRHFKNNHKSHGVSNKDQPIAPRSWLAFLKEQIHFVKNNQDLVRRKMLEVLKETKHGTFRTYHRDGANKETPNTHHTEPAKKIESTNYTPYPSSPIGGSLSDFVFSKRSFSNVALLNHMMEILDPLGIQGCDFDDVFAAEKYEKELFAKIATAIAKYEGFDLRFDADEGTFREKVFDKEVSDFAYGQLPVPNGTHTYVFKIQHGERYFEFCANKRGMIDGSIIFIVWEADSSYYIGTVYGLYYFKTIFYFNKERTKLTDQDCKINKVLSGKKVKMKAD